MPSRTTAATVAPQEQSEHYGMYYLILSRDRNRLSLFLSVPFRSTSRSTHLSEPYTLPYRRGYPMFQGLCAPEAVPRVPPFAFLCDGGRTGDLLPCPPGAASCCCCRVCVCVCTLKKRPNLYLPRTLPFRVDPPVKAAVVTG